MGLLDGMNQGMPGLQGMQGPASQRPDIMQLMKLLSGQGQGQSGSMGQGMAPPPMVGQPQNLPGGGFPPQSPQMPDMAPQAQGLSSLQDYSGMGMGATAPKMYNDNPSDAGYLGAMSQSGQQGGASQMMGQLPQGIRQQLLQQFLMSQMQGQGQPGMDEMMGGQGGY